MPHLSTPWGTILDSACASRKPWLAPIACTLGFALALVGVQRLCLVHGVPFMALSRDPSSHLLAPAYVGLLSNLGGMGWGAAAGLAVFGWRFLRRLPGRQEQAKALGWMALLTLVLGLDDIALLHDDWLLRVGMREKMFFLIYGTSALAWMYRFRSILKEVRFSLLLSLGCFALSIVADVRPLWGEAFHHLFEDGFKMLGIVNWVILAAQLFWGQGPESEVGSS